MSDYEHHDDFHHHDEQNHHEKTHEHQEQQHHNDSNEESASHLNQASAPPSDDNGYIVVPPTPQSSVDRDSHEQQHQQQQQDIGKLLEDLSNDAESKLNEIFNDKVVVAEADSSTASPATLPSVSPQQTEKKAPSTQETKKEAATTTDGSKSFLCPYYFLGKYEKNQLVFHMFCGLLFLDISILKPNYLLCMFFKQKDIPIYRLYPVY
jgi:hypothetical protein